MNDRQIFLKNVAQHLRRSLEPAEEIAAVGAEPPMSSSKIIQLLDVVSVGEEMIIIAFTWPLDDKKYAFAYAFDEDSFTEFTDDVGYGVAAMVTFLDESLAGGAWLEDAELPSIGGINFFGASWQFPYWTEPLAIESDRQGSSE